MLRRSAFLFLASTFFVGLTGCTEIQSLESQVRKEAQYWQRADVAEAAHMEGPKAQQTLHRDIANCVVEIRELNRLGALRTVTPGNTTKYDTAPDPDTPAGELAEWDSPERYGYMRAEHLPYQDFETCMIYKGWERVEYLPYDQAEQSRRAYLEAITGDSYRTRHNKGLHPVMPPAGDYEDLND